MSATASFGCRPVSFGGGAGRCADVRNPTPQEAFGMQTVTSPDGTRIAIERFSDAGPALLKIGGAFCDRSFAAPLTEALSERFGVYGYDRRGRRRLGPG